MTDQTPVVEGSFDPNLISVVDRMRSKVGDIGPEFLIPDVTYQAQLNLETDWRLATAAIADQLASMFSKKPSSYTAVGDFSSSWVDRGAAWRKLADQLRSTVAAESGSGSTGHIAVAPTRGDEMGDWEYTRPRR